MRSACRRSGCGSTLKKRWPPPVFAALLDHEVAAKSVTIDGALVRLPGHSLTLGAKDEALWKKIAADLARDRFKPPRVRDFAETYATPEPNVRKLLRQLARLGRLVEVAPDQFFLRPVVAEMIAIAHGLGRRLHAAQFRDKLDNGRKLAILILEFFDRHGITVRRGDLRRTVAQKLGQYGPAPSLNADVLARPAIIGRWRGSAPGGAAGLQSQRGSPDGS